MKKITFNGIEYYYKVKNDGYWTRTFFFKAEDNFIKKFNIFGNRFGPLVNKPEEMFSIHLNIENPNVTKEAIAESFKSELESYNKFKKRQEEIQKGEIL